MGKPETTQEKGLPPMTWRGWLRWAWFLLRTRGRGWAFLKRYVHLYEALGPEAFDAWLTQHLAEWCRKHGVGKDDLPPDSPVRDHL